MKVFIDIYGFSEIKTKKKIKFCKNSKINFTK